MIITEGLILLVGSENGRFECLDKRRVLYVHVGKMDESTWLDVAAGVDVQVVPPACDAAVDKRTVVQKSTTRIGFSLRQRCTASCTFLRCSGVAMYSRSASLPTGT